MAHYPADTFQEATEIAIEASNQLHGVINGDADAEVTVEDGSKIPSVRKAMVDSLYFKPPIAWAQGEYEDTYNQLREFVDGDVRTWWFAKGATVSTPVLMSTNPHTDQNWSLWGAITVKRYTCVADMVSDVSLSVGQIVETIGYYNDWVGTNDKPKGGNRYEIVAGGTGTVDGGSFIVLSNGLQAKGLFTDGVVNVCQFGAKGDGISDDTLSIHRATTYANTSTTNVVATNLNIRLYGSQIITVKTSVDFSGSTIICSDWTGYLYIARTKTPVTYSQNDPVVTGLMGSTNLLTGSSVFSGWDTTSQINDCFIKINTDQDFYKYRLETKKRIDLNRTYRNGVVSTPLKYNLSGVQVTSIVSYPLEEHHRSVKGLTLDMSTGDSQKLFIKIESSMFTLEDIRFVMNDYELSVTNPNLISVINSCHVKLHNIHCSYVNRTTATTGFTYTLTIANSYDVTCDEISADGDGWGATGSDFSARITFENCKLNRIDFHEPFLDFMNIRNCVIGSRGVSMTALGDLNISNCDFILRNLTHSPVRQIIVTRGDTGGFCDGNLNVTDCRIMGSAVEDPHLFSHVFDAGNDKPSESPINYRLWDKIYIRNVRCDVSGYSVNFFPKYSPCNGALSFPSRLTVLDSFGGKLYGVSFADAVPYKTSTRATSPLDDDFNFRIYISNTDLYKIEINGNSQFNIELKGDGVFCKDNKGVSLVTNVGGHYLMTRSNVSKLDTYFNSVNYGPIIAEIVSSYINDDTSLYGGSDVVRVSNNARVSIIQTKIKVPGLFQRFVDTLAARHIDCSYYHTTPIRVFDITNDLQSGNGTLTFKSQKVVDGQECTLVCGYTSDNSTTYTKTYIPGILSSSVVCVGMNQFVKLYRDTATTISVSSYGSPIIRRLIIEGQLAF